MPFSADNFLENNLRKRKEQNAFRQLVNNNNLIDFCSNDYLGFANSKELQKNIEAELKTLENKIIGSTGSRLIAGNSEYAENLEKAIAKYHQAEAGLIYNSGYDVNVGLYSSVASKNDTIIYDELIHASIHDGIKLSGATAYMFKHNDIEHLEERLKISNAMPDARLPDRQGNIFIAVESIYSMDGDEAPLKQISELCENYNANLIVDEAHATGVTLNNGKGKVQEFNLQDKIFARVHTFGKALGCHGAIVLGSNLLRDYLINFSRSFIYTTALPIASLVAIKQAYEMLGSKNNLQIELNELVSFFKNTAKEKCILGLIESNSPIQSLIVQGNYEVKKLALKIQDNKFDVRPILNPTVAKGKERLRICIHHFNTKEQIENLLQLF